LLYNTGFSKLYNVSGRKKRGKSKKGSVLNSLEANICLNLISGIGPVRVRELTAIFGSPECILSQPKRELKRVPGISEKLAANISNWQHTVDLRAEIELAAKAGVEIISRDCSSYPAWLREIPDPPLVLYLRGSIDSLQEPECKLAVVGSRRATRYGIEMAKRFCTAAAAAKWITVSGLALGIDTAAHRSTIDAGGRTVAVIGSGLCRLYPQENLQLAREISENGAVISEFPMNFPPDRRTFPMRNRIISGLSCATLVVEAGLKSGSLITANQAADQGRQVFAVPGRADASHSRGCHSLIRSGAVLAENFSDILEEFNNADLFSAAAANLPSVSDSKKPKRSLQLSEMEQKIVSYLEGGEASVDSIVTELDLPVGKTFATLIKMETRKLVEALPGRLYRLPE